MYSQSMFQSKNMKIVKKKSTENCHFYSRGKSLFVALACFRNEFIVLILPVLDSIF